MPAKRVFAVNGNRVACRMVKEGIKAAAVWYRAEPFTNEAHDTKCGHCSR